MPRLCEFVDRDLDEEHKLAKQYITTVEVGGAHAHIFYPLLNFLELKTLVVTDIDAVRSVVKKDRKGNDRNVWEKCPVAQGERTSNTAIREWFRPANEKDGGEAQTKVKQAPDLDMETLLAKTDAEKISGYRRIAYQVPEAPESSTCARSYEDALVLANPAIFQLADGDGQAEDAWEIAQNLPKAETALRFAIHEKNWNVPRYITEGLKWLSEPPPPPAEDTAQAPADVPPEQAATGEEVA